MSGTSMEDPDGTARTGGEHASGAQGPATPLDPAARAPASGSPANGAVESPAPTPPAPPVHEALPRQASTLSRQAFALYTALIVYASWFPFSGWRSLGLGPLDYLGDPFPKYWTVFDVVTNVLGYMPFGALAVLAAWPRCRGLLAVVLATLGGTLLSGVMEAVQTYLPTRVASNLDLATNVLGALLGAAIAAPATGALLERGFLRRLRFRWFERDPTR